MEKFLIDTTVLVDHLRGKNWAKTFLTRQNLFVSFVSYAELLQGARNKQEQKLVKELIRSFAVKWGSEAVNRTAINLLSKYFLKFNLRLLDALIAATALENSLILVTDNTKHFKFIPHLKVLSPKSLRNTKYYSPKKN